MGELVFVGLGLHDDLGISLKGVEEVKTANMVFLETYTSALPGFSLKRFEDNMRKKLTPVSRRDLEDMNGQAILKAAANGKAVLLVPGDPLVATTHVTLRIAAEKEGIKTRVVHGASILSAAIGLSGLHNYKFGKSVTIPFPDENPSETPYQVVVQNQKLGLHTLCFLDIQAEQKRYLNVHDGLNELLRIEKRKTQKAVTLDTLAVGIARAGNTNPKVKAGYISELLNYDFGDPPHCIVFPGKLHFMEADALIVLADAPEDIRKATK